MSGQLAIEQEKFGQKVARLGFECACGGHRSLARLKFNPEPPRCGTLPSLFSILPRQVNGCNTHAPGEEVCQDKLEHHLNLIG